MSSQPLIIEVMLLRLETPDDNWCYTCNLPSIYAAIFALVDPWTLHMHTTIQAEQCHECGFRRISKKSRK